MQITKVLLCVFFTFATAAACVAQDANKKQETKDKAATERAIENTTTRMMRLFETANLSDEQKEKARTVIKDNIGTVMVARKAQFALLTDEQKQNRQDAIAKAKEDGKKGSQLNAIGIKAMGLTKEAKAEYDAAAQKVNKATGEIKKAITALLTQEQLALLPKDNAKEVVEKTKTVTLKLPKMECGGCAAAVKKALSSVDGIANIKTDPVKNVCSFDAPMSLDIKAMSDKFADDGVLQFKGWSFPKGPIL